MIAYKPLQLSFMNRVLEQDRRFYFIASVTMGVNLKTGEALLETDFLKDAFECMGEAPVPDPGMPKPRAEVLVTGKCFAASGKPVPASEVSVRVGPLAKRLYVFGERYWLPGNLGKRVSDPAPFTEMPIAYDRAFGGEGFGQNPQGKGVPVKNGDAPTPLPNIENPDRLIGSPMDRPDPAGFGPLDPGLPQRMRFQGTYDRDYKQKYFPGYPADHDWRFFMAAPEDQWLEGFFAGNETFSITRMHPSEPFIEGALPGYRARCFLRTRLEGGGFDFAELDLNLDTVWLFPEKMMALLTWRKGIETADDEAAAVTEALLAYEYKKDAPRPLEHYKNALERRLSGDDPFLNNFNTADLIPDSHKTAMEILLGGALAGGEDSELRKNVDRRIEEERKKADQRIEESVSRVEKLAEETGTAPEGKVDVRQMLDKAKSAKPEKDSEELNRKLEAILPGITAGDPALIDFKEFSFKKVDQLFETMKEFMGEKKKQAIEMAGEEIGKAKKQILEQIETSKKIGGMPPDKERELLDKLKVLDEINYDDPPLAPLPRMPAEQIESMVSGLDPRFAELAAAVQAMKAAGVDDENTRGLEKKMEDMMRMKEEGISQRIGQAQADFSRMYLLGAHFMTAGLSPHREPVEEVAQKFLDALAAGEDLANRDFALVDLSYKKLDGIDLSGCLLEQVNLQGASLRGAILKNTVLARAILDDADFTGADFENANVGAVHAHRTRFSDANLKSAKLSKGDFADADFTGAELEDAETLEIKVAGADFSRAHMPSMKFIEADLSGSRFGRADLSTSVFFKCRAAGADFTGALLNGSVFSEVVFDKVVFDEAIMEKVCFTAPKPEEFPMVGASFKKAVIHQSSLQGMVLQGADFSGADLENSNLMSADLTGAQFRQARARSTQFRKARLFDANLNGIDLLQGSLAKAYLVGATFVGANLFGVDFLRSTITNTDFTGANLDTTLIEHWRPR